MNGNQAEADDYNYDVEHYSFRLRQASKRVNHAPKTINNMLQLGSQTANQRTLAYHDMSSSTAGGSAASSGNNCYPSTITTTTTVSSTTGGAASAQNPPLNSHYQGASSLNHSQLPYSHAQNSMSASSSGTVAGGGTPSMGPRHSLGQVASSAAMAAAAVISLNTNNSNLEMTTVDSNSPRGHVPTKRHSVHRSSLLTNNFDVPDGAVLSGQSSKDSTGSGPKPLRKQRHVLSRSNSSLEDKDRPPLTLLTQQREYGSTSSIDVIGIEVKTANQNKQMGKSSGSAKTRSAIRGVQFDLKTSGTDQHPVAVKSKDSSFAFLRRFRKSSGSHSTATPTPISSASSTGGFFSDKSGSGAGLATGTGTSSAATLSVQDSSSYAERECPNTIQLPGGPRLSKVFVHYDSQSLCWELPSDYHGQSTSIASSGDNPIFEPESEATNEDGAVGLQHRSCNHRRQHTGASAASVREAKNSSTSSQSGVDCGDGQANSLVQVCPYFRNELGGELLRIPATTRLTAPVVGLYPCSGENGSGGLCNKRVAPSCNAVGLLETASGSVAAAEFMLNSSDVLINGTAPCSGESSHFAEFIDTGATYFKRYFAKYDDHQNWFGLDDTFGPIAISLRREKLFDEAIALGGGGAAGLSCASNSSALERGSGVWSTNSRIEQELSTGGSAITAIGYHWRLIIRTRELYTLRGSIREDLVPCSSRFSTSRGVPVKDVLQAVCPDLPLTSLRQGLSETRTHNLLIRLDEQTLMKSYKVGVLLCKSGQATEEEMYNNEHSSPAFEEFLDSIGKRIALQNFDKYKGGLDTKADTTGTHSYYAVHRGSEIMFHVSTLLPYTPNNNQQVMRKRHIGNDIVTIVFQEPGALPFSPKTVRSQFQHIFILVRVHNPCTENTTYSVALSRSCDVPPFGPPLPARPVFSKSNEFIDLILSKAMNGENAAHKSRKFIAMQRRTREDYLKDLAKSHVNSVTLDSKSTPRPVVGCVDAGKFFLGSGRKKDKHRTRPDITLHAKGALVWPVCVCDAALGEEVSCLLAIGWDHLLLMECSSRLVIFNLPTRAVIGWTRLADDDLRIYYNNGEFLQLSHLAEDDINEIVQRLDVLSPGCHTMQVSLERSLASNLSFSVLPHGILTVKSVEPCSPPARIGVREGARVLQLCGQPLVTLETDVYHLLRSAATLVLVLLPPDPSGRIRRGSEVTDMFFTNEALPFFKRHSTASTPSPSSSSNRRQMSPSSPESGASSSAPGLPPHLANGGAGTDFSCGEAAADPMKRAHDETSQQPLQAQVSPPTQTKISIGVANATTTVAVIGSHSNFRDDLRRLIDPGVTEEDFRSNRENSNIQIGGRTFDLPVDLPGTTQPTSSREVTTASSAEETLSDWERLVHKASQALLVVDSPRQPKTSSTGSLMTQSLYHDSPSASSSHMHSSPERRSLKTAPTTSLIPPTAVNSASNSGANVGASSNQQLQFRVRELEDRCRQLDRELIIEKELRISRETECESLRRENQHLRGEKEATGAQLTQFTEWFFDSVNQKV